MFVYIDVEMSLHFNFINEIYFNSIHFIILGGTFISAFTSNVQKLHNIYCSHNYTVQSTL